MSGTFLRKKKNLLCAGMPVRAGFQKRGAGLGVDPRRRGQSHGCFILTPQLIMNNLFRHRRAMSWREIRQPRLLGLLLRGVRTWNAKRRERAREKREAAEAAKRAVERSIHLAWALRAGAIWRGPARAPFNLTNRTSMHGGIKR